MSEVSVSDDARARSPGRRHLAPVVAGVLALLGTFAVTAPAQAGYYEDSQYGYRPYATYRYGCSACGCWQHCYSRPRPPLLYERRYRYVEREYVERRYGWPVHHHRRYYGYYHPYGSYRSWSRPFPWGYGGVRDWRTPYRPRYEPYAYRYEPSAERYEEPPRPPAPIWDGNDE